MDKELEDQEEILRFYFGDVGPSDRLRMEARLRREPDLLDTYLVWKREVETSAEGPEVPSKAFRKRLRRRVLKEVSDGFSEGQGTGIRRLGPGRSMVLCALAALVALTFWLVAREESPGERKAGFPAIIDDSGEPRDSYTL